MVSTAPSPERTASITPPAENPSSVVQLDKLTGNTLAAEVGAGNYNDQSNTVVVNDPPAPLSSNSSLLDTHFVNSDGTTKFNTLVPYSLTG